MNQILKRINSFFAETDIPATLDEEKKALIIADVLELTVDTSAKSLVITKLAFAAKDLLHKEGNLTIDLQSLAEVGEGSFFRIDLKGQVQYNLGKKDTNISVEWKTDDQTKPHLLFGVANGSRIQADEVFGRVGMHFHPETSETKVEAEGRIRGGKLVLSLEDGDGFITALLPSEGFTTNFDLEFGISSDKGLFFKGSSGLELVIPLYEKLGPIELKTIHLGATIDSSEKAFAFNLGVSAGAKLGPFDLVVENIGASGRFVHNKQGQILNQLDFEMGFLPPKGLGLAVDMGGMIKGGGYLYLDHEKGEYGGVAEVAVLDLVHLKAICIITTKMPDGKPGFSFFLLITAEFTPVQLGFGFTLNGVGGLVGVNRGMNVDKIREGVRNNTLEDILFPKDPVADAPRILRTMGQVFPVQRDQYTFGLMAIIGWGVPTLVEARLGFVLQVPQFKLAILGIIECNIPTKVLPLIVLKSAFAITFDSTAKLITFDSSLYDSRILWMDLYGDMAMRIKYGDNAGFLMSMGGFHPEYTPPAALRVGAMRRMTIVLLNGNPHLQLESYFAITPNTVQFGARLDFYMDLGIVQADGYFGLDVLIQFSPFYFKVSIEAFLAVKSGDLSVLTVYVYGALSGPNPWNFRGIGEFDFLGIGFEINVDITWPDDYEQEVLENVEVLPLLEGALNDARNWEVVFPKRTSTLTTLRDLNEEIEIGTNNQDGAEQVKTLMTHPFCTIVVRQKILPLNVDLTRFGQFQPVDGNKFTIREKEGFLGNLHGDQLTFAQDQFAPDQFFTLSEAEKLQRPGFENFDAGLVLQDRELIASEDEDEHTILTRRLAGHEVSEWDDYNIGLGDTEYYETLVETPVKPEIFDKGIQQTLVARSHLGRQASLRQQLGASAPSFQQQYRLTDRNTLVSPELAGIQTEFSSVSEAEAALEQLGLQNEKLASSLQVSLNM